MRHVFFVCGALTAIVLAGLVASCGDPKTQLPTGPSVPSVASIEISGPDSVAPGRSAQFLTIVRLFDGTNKNAMSTQTLRWRSSNTSVLQINSSGLATAGNQTGEATLTAEMTTATSAGLRRSTKEVVVLPDGTYRVVGTVTEVADATVPVVGAHVVVTGTSLSAITDLAGQYRLYGVPPDAEIRVSADGYQPLVRRVELASHTTQNFQLTFTSERLLLSGSYRMAVDADSCTSSPPLPEELRHRSYEVVLTQSGPTVDVAMTEPRFRLNSINRGNRFSGRVDAVSATFTLEPYYSYYYPYYGPTAYPNVAERLPNGTFLVVEGTARLTGSRDGLSGTLNGGISNWDSRFPNGQYLGSCYGSLRFTLSPR